MACTSAGIQGLTGLGRLQPGRQVMAIILQRTSDSATGDRLTEQAEPASYRLPTLSTAGVTLRELQVDDAESLFSLLSAGPVGRFILPPPGTVERFTHFIAWTHHQQEAGRHLCFGIVPEGSNQAVGLIQVRREGPRDSTAEWGFVIAQQYWGTGLFVRAAGLVLDFLFGQAALHRLEARTVVANDRGNGVLRKLGAVREGILRDGLCRDGHYHDQVLWSILSHDWEHRQQLTLH
jgi:RimJ/RimL family protein N-acetyltransferase